MPKKTIAQIQLPPAKPDCCADCPLCGIFPADALAKNDRNNRVCLGTMRRMGNRFTKVRASNRDSKHPLHRHCDYVWDAWMQLPGRRFGVSYEAYLRYIYPKHLKEQTYIDTFFK